MLRSGNTDSASIKYCCLTNIFLVVLNLTSLGIDRFNVLCKGSSPLASLWRSSSSSFAPFVLEWDVCLASSHGQLASTERTCVLAYKRRTQCKLRFNLYACKIETEILSFFMTYDLSFLSKEIKVSVPLKIFTKFKPLPPLQTEDSTGICKHQRVPVHTSE